MKVVLSDLAVQRLREIQSYIAYDNLAAATRVLNRLRQSIEILADHPKLGRTWQGGPTRALTVSGLPYRIHYRISGETVEIITIFHTSQLPPKL